MQVLAVTMACPGCGEVVKPLVVETSKHPELFENRVKVICPEFECDHTWYITNKDLELLR